MKQSIILFFIITFFYTCTQVKSAEDKVNKESIDYKSFCLNNVCIGDSINKIFSIYGKPDTILTDKFEDIDGQEWILKLYRYYDNKDKNLYIDFKEDYNNFKGEIVGFENYGNQKFNISGLKIADDTNKVKNFFPNSYNKAIVSREKQLALIQNKYEKEKLNSEYTKNDVYKNKIDSLFNNDLKSVNNYLNLSVEFKYPYNKFGDAMGSSVEFFIFKGKLSGFRNYYPVLE